MMRTCSRCSFEKDDSEFGVNNAREDGLQAYCRDCMREYARSRGRLKPIGWERKTANIVAYRKEYRKNNREKLRLLENDWRERNMEFVLERQKIKDRVRYAVKTGKIVKFPCWVCGSLEVEGHHADYDRPLDVVWLCPEHHRQVHHEHKLLIVMCGRTHSE
jgi:hypothetical protein